MLVPGEVLDRLRRRAPHRQVRAERVAKDVHVARGLQARAPLRALDPVAQRVSRYGGPVAVLMSPYGYKHAPAMR
jgi:hypothetical protein